MAVMRAALDSERLSRLQAMQLGDLDEVQRLENAVYEFPWSRGNFVDSLAQGYESWVLRGADHRLLAYYLAMRGFEEMHLLNISVDPAHQGQGLARGLLEHLCRLAWRQACPQIWLEVRLGNARARALYQRFGFVEAGVRRGYYPARQGREDAVLMSLDLRQREDLQ